MPSIFYKLLKFLAIGIPAFIIAIPLNYFLVEKILWPKPAAYALVLVVQVTINFFACIFFVFKRDKSKRLRSQFAQFMWGILTARFFDWALYSLLTQWIPYYTAVQLFNVLVFSLAKFSFARRAIEGNTIKDEVKSKHSNL